ncbi:MAG TPA: MauE/DoxX family redox-associated membrane protein [Ilumatobacter sp.]|nr:MauE/DoxX family redox-associated membrane protein [Ilumatobacter sp.]
MSLLAAVAGVVVGVAFVVAGASKLAAGKAWPAQAAGLRVPAAVARVVPFGELVVGALLAVQVWRPWPAVAALVLLGAFTVLIVAHLRAGSHPPCACFGAWSARPIGWGHVTRNAALLALAVVALL